MHACACLCVCTFPHTQNFCIEYASAFNVLSIHFLEKNKIYIWLFNRKFFYWNMIYILKILKLSIFWPNEPPCNQLCNQIQIKITNIPSTLMECWNGAYFFPKAFLTTSWSHYCNLNQYPDIKLLMSLACAWFCIDGLFLQYEHFFMGFFSPSIFWLVLSRHPGGRRELRNK